MKQLIAFIRKEFYHVFRDRRTLLILFGLPVVQILLFGFALSSEVKNIGIAVMDNSHDAISEGIVNRINTSTYFHVEDPILNYHEIETRFKTAEIKCALIFPAGFEKQLGSTGKAQVQIIADASDPNNATIAVNYISAIIANYQMQLNRATPPYQIIPQVRQLYN